MSGISTKVRRVALVAAVVALAAPGQAAAQTSEPNPRFYFECVGPSKVQNTVHLTNDPTWTTRAPTESYTAGGGCGYFDSALSGEGPETIHDGVFAGRFGGAFRAVKVELHNLVMGRATALAFYDAVIVRLTVDGIEVANRIVYVNPVLSASGLSQKVTFEIKHGGLNVPAGGDDRRVVLTVDSVGSAWMFGASEFPSSIEFVPPAPAPGS